MVSGFSKEFAGRGGRRALRCGLSCCLAVVVRRREALWLLLAGRGVLGHESELDRNDRVDDR